MINKDTFKLSDPSGLTRYGSNMGSFFVIKKDKSIDDESYDMCREIFSDYFIRGKSFIGFSKTGINIDLINKFFGIIEKKLKVKTLTIFYKTSQENTIAIRVSPFWMRYEIRRSVFTLLLRCAAVFYNGRNFNEALNSYRLSKLVRPALNKFLKGYTFTNLKMRDMYNEKIGFVKLFQNSPRDYLNKHLIKTNSRTYDCTKKIGFIF